MNTYFVVVIVLLISGTNAKPTGDKENEVKVADQKHGPHGPDEEFHGVLMHGDKKIGADHKHDHEQLIKNVPNQHHGPHSPDHEEWKGKHTEHELKEEFGPKDPMEDLHGVLMHGDTEHGIHHEEHFEEVPRGTDRVLINDKVEDGATTEAEKVVLTGDIGTVDGEELIHGKQGVHKHSHDSHEEDALNAKQPGPFSMEEDILHQIMHDGNIDKHTDEKLLAAKKIGYEELMDMKLDDELLSQTDIKKLLKNNLKEYKKFRKERHGVKDTTTDNPKQHEHWSLWDQVSKLRLTFGGGDDSTEDRDPNKAEWEDVILRRPIDEDDIAFKMDIGANSGPIYARKKKFVHDEQ